MESLQSRVRNPINRSCIKRKIPILEWLPKYSTDCLIGDIVAGLTVGLTVIPQGIAYAIIAGLPAIYGLYSAFFGSFVYLIFGSCKDITIGPTAVMSILTYEYAAGDEDVAVLLSFTTGLIIFLFGVLNLGFLIAFISKPVISGFVSAAALTIVTSQVKGLLGIQVSSHGVVDTWRKVFGHIGETRWQDATLGFVCMILLLAMRKLKDVARFRPRPEDAGGARAFKFFVFIMSVSRNAVVVIVAAILAALLNSNQPFTITGPIAAGLPDVGPPSFVFANGTAFDVLKKAGAGVIILPLIAVLENFAIASAFANGKVIDATQEMLALGLCNTFGAFFRSMPTTGSFSRTAVNATSGVKTPAGGIVTGGIVVLALAVLTPYFKFIPVSALAAVIICAVIFMVEYEVVMPMWRTSKSDLLVLCVSFLGCIFWKLEWGLLLGAGVHLAILLARGANPGVDVTHVTHIEGEGLVPRHVVVTPQAGLSYVNAPGVRQKVAEHAEVGEGAPVVMDCRHFSNVDYSAAKDMHSLWRDLSVRGQTMLFRDARAPVADVIRATNAQAILVTGNAELAKTLRGTSPACVSSCSSLPPSEGATEGLIEQERFTPMVV